jgi:3-phenylpropionate/trans-cinnamate dioxygenase ferredoxin subunit
MSDFVKAGALKDFPVNRTTQVVIDGQDVCVANSGGQLTAFDDRCTHAFALLSGSDIEENCVTCPLHGARFDVTTGAAVTLPAVRPVKMHVLETRGDEIFIKLQ